MLIGMVLGTLAVLADTPVPAPSVAVVGLTAKKGVDKDVADLLADHMVNVIRKTHRFSRVVSTSELETALSLESQKQMANGCDSSACIAEIAGSLGVDFILTGNIGRLGEKWLLSLKLIASRNGIAAASSSRAVEGTSEASLIVAVESLVHEVLVGAGLGGDDPAPAQEPLPTPAVAATSDPPPVVAADSAARPVEPSISQQASPPVWRMPVLVGGVAALSGGGLAVLAGLVAAVVAVSVFVLPFVVFVPLPVKGDARDTLFTGATLAVALLSGMVTTLGLAGLAGGALAVGTTLALGGK